MTRPKGSTNKPKVEVQQGTVEVTDDHIAMSEDGVAIIEAIEPFELSDGEKSLPIDENLTTEKILETFPQMAPPVVDETAVSATREVPAFLDGNNTADQAEKLAAKDEVAISAPGLVEGLTFEQMIYDLRAREQYELAEQLIEQKAQSDRWQAHEEEVAARMRQDAFAPSVEEQLFEVVRPGSEGDPFTATEPFFRPYTVQDVKDIVCAALVGKAESWEEEARVESLRGAGSPATVATLKWGATQLREVAGAVSHLGDGEWIEPVSEEAPES